MVDDSSFLGIVVSTVESPTPSEIKFVVKRGSLHKGQFVEIEHSDGCIVAQVVDILKANRYFERADSVKGFQDTDKNIEDYFPISDWEFMIATAKPIGFFSKDGSLSRCSNPPSPGAQVNIANNKNLSFILGFDEKGLYLGDVDYHDLELRINIDRLLKKHLAVLAMSGAGKSVTVKRIIEELIQRTKEQGRIAVLVMDVHGEYTNFAQPVPNHLKHVYVDYSDKTKLIKGKDIRIGVPSLDISLIATIIKVLSPQQRRELERIFDELLKEMQDGVGPFDLSDVRKKIEEDQKINEKTAAALISWINNLESLGIFSKTDHPSIKELLNPGGLTVVDMSDLLDLRVKQTILAYFGSRLFAERIEKKVPPFLLVVEESHQFAPMASEENAISRDIIETIAREGRKFGVCLCLVSQRPVNLSTTALAQCNTHILLRITNPNDLAHVSRSSEGIDQRSLDMLTSLKVGEALIVGEAVNHPVFFRVRKNKSQPSKHELSLEEAAKQFELEAEKRNAELDSFL
ncbi:MAG: DUF87 domain-containing protein [Candidatus Diapherotrites archaeon]|nr:DUF87 domain-containing protein [Candidatus Diapherotrites archaeon]